MPDKNQIQRWREEIRKRYESYLQTSFYFKDSSLRESFARALEKYDLMRDDDFPESANSFAHSVDAHSLAKEYFQDKATELLPALINEPLYRHQEQAIRLVYGESKNAVVATGTASGKTESFLYPILFELYCQHLTGELKKPGVRALILYPMNALANDQRQRLGDICRKLQEVHSEFRPIFGQYIGETPEDETDHRRNADKRAAERFPNELIFRKEIRESPPHILLTNYSMLEYLLIRPQDSELFDNGNGRYWRFIVLDEAHQYRGAKGMEMGMLVRRLKQRLRDGGCDDKFCCIATSATITSEENKQSRKAVAEFAGELFGEQKRFLHENIVFAEHKKTKESSQPQRFHLFMRALEGAFLVHHNGKDEVALNRETVSEYGNETPASPLEIALCGECGQHYYVGHIDSDSVSQEAIRDPSQEKFGVDFYLPLNRNTPTEEPEESGNEELLLCRRCGKISRNKPACECNALIPVKKCKVHDEHKDQLEKCEVCKYRRGAIGDPVQEIVHGADGPNVVIATALHGLLSENRRKILAFTDSRQEAAFFAWYAEDSYRKVRDRNLIFRTFDPEDNSEILSLEDIADRLRKICDENKIFRADNPEPTKERKVRAIIYREVLPERQRISLEGVGLVKWFVAIPKKFMPPEEMFHAPWNFQEDEAKSLIAVLLDNLRTRQAVNFPPGKNNPYWKKVSPYPQSSVCQSEPQGRGRNVFGWSNPQRSIVGYFLTRLLPDRMEKKEKKKAAERLMVTIWSSIQDNDSNVEEASRLLQRASDDGLFRLNLDWLRTKALQAHDSVFKCNTCERLHFQNIRDVCLRNRCPGKLSSVKIKELPQNHYRILYENRKMPVMMRAEEHTAQLRSEVASERQEAFKNSKINLLSSSTTFEVGVDLGDLEVVFLRNVPPEPFNYKQRSGRAGRRNVPGLALTYCRRNPHDLYHYANTKERILEGKIHTPQLRLRNEKIISRHVIATALSEFFHENPERFKNVEQLIGKDWRKPQAVVDFKHFCQRKQRHLENILEAIVPIDMHNQVGLDNRASWIDKATGEDSPFAAVESSVCDDYIQMEKLEKEMATGQNKKPNYKEAHKAEKRKQTIAKEIALTFLSRNAIIPKYGFPVDVVNLDTRPSNNTEAANVSLQRDLSQAIAEFAPGGKVVANKKEWESTGIKIVPGKELPVRYYCYDSQHNFRQWEREQEVPKIHKAAVKKYLWPRFGFVTNLFQEPKAPQRRVRRLYTTRPYFRGFVNDLDNDSNPRFFFGVGITQALPGKMVILCEGKTGAGFFICRSCRAGFSDRKGKHKSPTGTDCKGALEKLSLGHEFVTDVTRLHFPGVTDEWSAYSLAYAILLGTASTLDVPNSDLNVTITGRKNRELSIVLYDNVPGGAGLVANLEQKNVFQNILRAAQKRVEGECGCGPSESCYGCLRSYRNQFAHPHLRREFALHLLEKALAKT